MGLTLGYLLSKEGIKVTIFEATPALGGLAGTMRLPDGTEVDRYYHAILSSDRRLRQLCEDLGLADRLRFCTTRMGFYHHGQIYSMNNSADFLRFPALRWVDRGRLGMTVLAALSVRDWHRLEGVNVEEWLVRRSGRRTYDSIWRPMLNAKFDGGFDDVPATYIWSRLVRMKSTRKGTDQKEEAGHIIGGYPTLLKAMAERIRRAGGEILLNCPIQEVVIEDGRASGLLVDGELHTFSDMVATVPVPVYRRLIPGGNPEYLASLDKLDYLGVICPLLVLDRPLTGYWTLNLTDERIPFTGVIETTAYIDPQHVGGYHLVYLPKYTAPGSTWQAKTDDEIREIWLQNLETMFPEFDRKSMRYLIVNRDRFTEPLHRLNSTHLIPSVKTPIAHLYLATTEQIYPELTNGESVIQYAQRAAQTILTEL